MAGKSKVTVVGADNIGDATTLHLTQRHYTGSTLRKVSEDLEHRVNDVREMVEVLHG